MLPWTSVPWRSALVDLGRRKNRSRARTRVLLALAEVVAFEILLLERAPPASLALRGALSVAGPAQPSPRVGRTFAVGAVGRCVVVLALGLAARMGSPRRITKSRPGLLRHRHPIDLAAGRVVCLTAGSQSWVVASQSCELCLGRRRGTSFLRTVGAVAADAQR